MAGDKANLANRAAILQTADDALAILEYLAQAPGPQALTRISQEFRTSKARAYRLLATLKARGYVHQDADTARYGFGAACARLAGRARLGMTLPTLCTPALRWLWQKTQETVYLAVLESDHGVVVEKFNSLHPIVATSALGKVLPLHAVSAGKVLLAGLPDDVIDRLVRSGLLAFTSATPTKREDIWTEVRTIRRQGYAINKEHFRDGVSGIAAPVRWSTPGTVAAAIAVCLPTSRLRAGFTSIRASVIEAAQAASTALGPDLDSGEAAAGVA